jgi:hypothetical protein
MRSRTGVLATRWSRAPLAAGLLIATAACAGDEPEAVEEASTPPAAAVDASPVSLTVDGFSTPESALFDQSGGVYLVSNINGAPTDKDGNGFISRVTPEGTVENLRWIAGGEQGATLNAPKGMALKGDTLFVSDIDVVRMFNRTTGQPLGERAVPGAVFLNDLDVGPDGTLYVTDSGIRFTASGMEQAGTDAVYRFGPDGQPVAVARGTELTGPNGVAGTEEGVIVVPFGGNQVYRLGADGARTNVAQLPAGQLDGVVRLADGSLLVSSWEGSAVYRVDAAGQATPVVEGVTSPADIGYDSARNRVLIPLFQGNQLRIESLPQ